MTDPGKSQLLRNEAFTVEAVNRCVDTGEPSQGASVAFIRSWPISILCLCLFPLLLALGNWQLQRAQQKQQLLDDIDTRLRAQPVDISGLRQEQTYTPVRLSGTYTDEYFYLDNRTRNGRVGYEILQVFEAGDSSGKVRWLVNRGWLPAGAERARLPVVDYPRNINNITGFLYPVEHSDGTENPVVPRSRIQRLETAFTDYLGLTRASWHIRLSADSDTALETDWQLVNIDPQKHRGYAVQWFSMAVMLVVLWLLAATDIRQMVGAKYAKSGLKER